MKDFFKMLLASFTGTVIFSLICFFATIFSVAGIIGLLEEEAGPIVPEQAVLTIDMSQITISEQTQEVDIFTLLQEENAPSPIGVLDFAAAINAARFDPAIKYIFLKSKENSPLCNPPIISSRSIFCNNSLSLTSI